jgi:hypothetical protein
MSRVPSDPYLRQSQNTNSGPKPVSRKVTFNPDISQTKSVPYIDWVILVKKVAKKSTTEDNFIDNITKAINGLDPDIYPLADLDEKDLNDIIDKACSQLKEESKCPINPSSSIVSRIPTTTIPTSSIPTSSRQQGSWFCSAIDRINIIKLRLYQVFQNIKRNLSASSDPYAEYGITPGSKGGRNKRNNKKRSNKRNSNKRSKRTRRKSAR